MRLPKVHGTIKRRLLINYRVDPAVMSRHLPPPFRPKLHEDSAIAGICLIRLEDIRPRRFPLAFGLSSENARTGSPSYGRTKPVHMKASIFLAVTPDLS